MKYIIVIGIFLCLIVGIQGYFNYQVAVEKSRKEIKVLVPTPRPPSPEKYFHF